MHQHYLDLLHGFAKTLMHSSYYIYTVYDRRIYLLSRVRFIDCRVSGLTMDVLKTFKAHVRASIDGRSLTRNFQFADYGGPENANEVSRH